MKACFKCLVEKPLTEFYPHSKMADGHLNKCKECSKVDSRGVRHKRIDYYRACDRRRGNRKTQNDVRRYRSANPAKYRAHNAVNNAVRDGRLTHQPCEVCGRNDSHAHHDDYSKPLDVRWLCPPHHQQWHAVNGEGRNAA